MIQDELIMNSRPLIVESLNDANSPTPKSPSNLPTLKCNAVMPSPEDLVSQNCIPKNDGDVFHKF